MKKDFITFAEEIISKEEFSSMIVLHYMSCHENYKKLTRDEKIQLGNFIYTIHLKDETKTDLGYFSDIVMTHYKDVLAGTFTKDDVYAEI